MEKAKQRVLAPWYVLISSATSGLPPEEEYKKASFIENSFSPVCKTVPKAKRGFTYKDKAEEEIRRSHKTRADVIPYFCPYCRLYHIGHRK